MTRVHARHLLGGEHGYALVLSLLILLGFSVLGLTLVTLGTTEVASSASWKDYSKAFYAADGGLESGVVGLRALLAATPAPTGAQLAAITAPTISTPGLSFNTYSVQQLNATPFTMTFATGPYAGLFGHSTDYQVTARVAAAGATQSSLTQVLQYVQVPLFQFGIFYGKGVDLELRPGPAMTFNGKIFANSNIYIAAGTTLKITQSVKSAGNIYREIKSESSTPNYNDPQISDANGNLQTLNFDHTYKPGFGSTWSSPSAWAQQANTTFGKQVQDSAMGVNQIIPPLPGLFSNPSNPDVIAHEMIELPQAGDSSALKAAKLYSQAGLRIVDGAATDAGNAPVTLPPGAVTSTSFFDAREQRTMTITQVDVAKLKAGGTLPANGVLYVASSSSPGQAVRLVNGSSLPSQGLTVVSGNPVYIAGDYNTATTGPNGNHPPAAVLGDAVTVLSNAWMANGYDAKGDLAFQNRAASSTTVNAAIATGPSSESTLGNDNGKANNLVRHLEDWTNQTFNYSGSLVALWHSQQVTGAWRCCGATSNFYYAPPNRVWSYDTLFDTSDPPGTPSGVVMQKGRWSRS
jgi:Tfp pilus assembly protein PilX